MSHREHVFRTLEATEPIGWLELECPECSNVLEYIGGQLMALATKVPGTINLYWNRGGTLHGYRCVGGCGKGFNYDDLPTSSWQVHFFTDEELAEYRREQEEIIRRMANRKGPWILYGPRQRPVG